MLNTVSLLGVFKITINEGLLNGMNWDFYVALAAVVLIIAFSFCFIHAIKVSKEDIDSNKSFKVTFLKFYQVS